LVRRGVLGLWLGTSGFAGAGQQGHAITVTGHDPAKRETPFASSLEKSLSKDQRETQAATGTEKGEREERDRRTCEWVGVPVRPEAVSFLEVAAWVATERVCCPFSDLAIESDWENGPLALRIIGREGVKQFIRMEFRALKLLRPCGEFARTLLVAC
jgi:hypothetical protein